MKKSFVKFVALALVLIMVLGAVPVSAASKTIENAGSLLNDMFGWLFMPIPQGSAFPEQEFLPPEVDGVTVTVRAPEGALPAGTDIEVAPVDMAAVQNAVDASSEVSGTVLAAVDITFRYRGEEIQPTAPVTVTMTSAALEGQDNLTVVHIDDQRASHAESVFAEFEEDTATFDADKFSVYAVVEPETLDPNARAMFKFFNGEELIATVIVKNEDKRTSSIEVVVYDPGVGTLNPGEFFKGWSKDADYNDNTTAYNIGDLREEIKTMPDWTEQQYWDKTADGGQDTSICYYAMIFTSATVTYLDEKDAAIKTDNILFKSGVNASYTIDCDYTPMQENEEFQGWYRVTELFGNNIASSGTITPSTHNNGKYLNDDDVTISGMIVLKAYAPEGFWLAFNQNPDTTDDFGGNYKGATYTAPIFCTDGVVPTSEIPGVDDMELAGYTFAGWYEEFTANTTSPDDNQWDTRFTKTTLTAADCDEHYTKIVYAKWNANAQADYTLVIWRQNVNDDKNAADADKTYDYYRSYNLQAAGGTSISNLAISSYTSSTQYWIYNKTTSDDAVINQKGTTIVNVYFDRALITYNFKIPDTYARTTQSWSEAGIQQYARYNGAYYQILYYSSYYYYYLYTGTLSSSQSGDLYVKAGSTYYTVYYRNNKWQYYVSGYYYDLPDGVALFGRIGTSDNRYAVNTWKNYSPATMTGLYGQKLTKYGYSWPLEYRWFSDGPRGTYGIDGTLSEKVRFSSIIELFNANSTSYTNTNVTNFYGCLIATDSEVRHYIQDTDGNWPDEETYVIYTTTKSGMTFRGFEGTEEYKYRMKLPSDAEEYRVITAKSGSDGNYTFTYEGDWIVVGDDLWTDWIDPGKGVRIWTSSGYNDDYDHYSSVDVVYPIGNEVEFRYARVKKSVSYLVGTFYDGDKKVIESVNVPGMPHSSEQIYFEASIASCGSYVPNTPTGYYFDGWYNDKDCKIPYSFENKTMPIDGKTVYAKFIQKQYRVFLRPEPDWTASDAYWENEDVNDIIWNDPNQARNYRIDYLGQISGGNAIVGSRPGYIMLGWFRNYSNGKYTEPFNFQTALDDSITVAYDKDDSFNATEDDGVTNNDKTRPWIEKKLDLYAKWRKTLPGSTGITVIYDAVEGEANEENTGHFANDTTTFTDPVPYGDQADAVTQGASTANNEDQKFYQWEVLKWNGTDWVSSGIKVFPGESFVVKKDDCKIEDNGLALTDPAYRATYTIMVQAVYVSHDPFPPTHIDWYSDLYDITGAPIDKDLIHTDFPTNNIGLQTSTGVDIEYDWDDQKGYVVKQTNVEINEAVEIPAFDTYTVDGYKFLGWARVNSEDGYEGIQSPRDVDNLDDLFLRWVPSETRDETAGHYEAKISGVWSEVHYVGADEVHSYHDLYAVWQPSFKIYHSGVVNGNVQTYYVPVKETKDSEQPTFNLLNPEGAKDGSMNLTKDTLYGGYYLKNGFSAETTKDGTLPVYDGTNWTWTEPQLTSAMAMNPVAGETYYIKEVPADKFLQSYIHYTYYGLMEGEGNDAHLVGTGKIGSLFAISDIDDLMYRETGFVVKSTDSILPKVHIVKSMTIQPQNHPENEATLTTEKVFHVNGDRNYLTYSILYNEIETGEDNVVDYGDDFTVSRYWKTPDNLYVTGIVKTSYSDTDNVTTLTATDAPVSSVISEALNTAGN